VRFTHTKCFLVFVWLVRVLSASPKHPAPISDTHTLNVATHRVGLQSLRARFFSDAARTHGNLRDEDRIFTNIYNDDDWGLKGAMKRVSLLEFAACFRENSPRWHLPLALFALLAQS
jgi:hypothetical protein